MSSSQFHPWFSVCFARNCSRVEMERIYLERGVSGRGSTAQNREMGSEVMCERFSSPSSPGQCWKKPEKQTKTIAARDLRHHLFCCLSSFPHCLKKWRCEWEAGKWLNQKHQNAASLTLKKELSGSHVRLPLPSLAAQSPLWESLMFQKRSAHEAEVSQSRVLQLLGAVSAGRRQPTLWDIRGVIYLSTLWGCLIWRWQRLKSAP